MEIAFYRNPVRGSISVTHGAHRRQQNPFRGSMSVTRNRPGGTSQRTEETIWATRSLSLLRDLLFIVRIPYVSFSVSCRDQFCSVELLPATSDNKLFRKICCFHFVIDRNKSLL